VPFRLARVAAALLLLLLLLLRSVLLTMAVMVCRCRTGRSCGSGW
jgi:hypothetical protein